MISDGCTLWFDGDWHHCCAAHDQAYFDGAVTLQTHIDLGQCVAQTSGGLAMGLLMMTAAAIWWLIFHRRRQ